jgi:hypothetical protein
MYIPERPRNYTRGIKSQIRNQQEKAYIPQGSSFQAGTLQSDQNRISLVILTVPLVLLVGGLGEHLLPDGAGGVAVEVGEENVEDFGVPADRVAFDALFDIL